MLTRQNILIAFVFVTAPFLYYDGIKTGFTVCSTRRGLTGRMNLLSEDLYNIKTLLEISDENNGMFGNMKEKYPKFNIV